MEAIVLGTKYEIKIVEETEENLKKYPLLRDNAGYTDITTKLIYILNYKDSEDTFNNLEKLKKKTLRHELVHAFLYESGLFNNSNSDWARNEEVVDWIAIQFEKLLSVFIKVNAIDNFGVDITQSKSKSAMASISIPAVAPAIQETKIPKIEIPIQDMNNLGKKIGDELKKTAKRMESISIKGGGG